MEHNGMVATMVAGESHPVVVMAASAVVDMSFLDRLRRPPFVAYRTDGVRGCIVARLPRFRVRSGRWIKHRH